MDLKLSERITISRDEISEKNEDYLRKIKSIGKWVNESEHNITDKILNVSHVHHMDGTSTPLYFILDKDKYDMYSEFCTNNLIFVRRETDNGPQVD